MVNRMEYIGGVKRVYTKSGGKLLLDENGDIDMPHLVGLAHDFTNVYNSGIEIIHVSSGAINSGRIYFRKTKEELYRDLDKNERIHRDQAIAATGQPDMMLYYKNAFNIFKQPVGQILVSSESLKVRKKLLNCWNTYRHLCMLGVIPIVNNDDTITIAELRYSENDTLWADQFLSFEGFRQDRNALGVIYSEHEFCDSDPRKNSQARVIPVVEEIDDGIMELASDEPGENTFGGMRPKLENIKRVTAAGYPVVLVPGKYKDREILKDVLAGEEIGTFFLP